MDEINGPAYGLIHGHHCDHANPLISTCVQSLMSVNAHNGDICIGGKDDFYFTQSTCTHLLISPSVLYVKTHLHITDLHGNGVFEWASLLVTHKC